MASLDTSVVNVILPVVTRALHSDVATIEWIVTMYVLVISGLLVSFGRLGDLRGHKTVYLSGYVVFVLGSALCGVAPTPLTLIAFRALQALGAAMLFANSPAILTKNFPAVQRGRVLGLQAMMVYLGRSAGPSLGGWLMGALSWRAVFYINVPIGLVAVWLSFRFIPRDPPSDKPERFDLPGAALSLSGLVALLLALSQGHAWGWTSPPTVLLLAGAVLLLSVFVVIERRVASPMLDLGLFHNRLFSAAAGTAVLNFVCVSTILFLMPFYLLQGRGLSAVDTGLLLTAQPLIMAVAAPLSGNLSDRVGSRLPTTLGMVILAFGLFGLSRLGEHTSLAVVAALLALTGLGAGIFVSPNNSALMGSAPRHRQGVAGGILQTGRNVGTVLGVGLTGAIFISVLAGGHVNHRTSLFDAIDTAFLVTTVFALAGALTSAVRETRS